MGFLIGLNILMALAGCILPVPSFLLSLREWLKIVRVSPTKPWRRVMSHVSVALFTLGTLLWIYAAVQQLRGAYSYDAPSASIGRWAFAGLVVLSSLAERKLRQYLLLGAFGILFFFASTIGDWTI